MPEDWPSCVHEFISGPDYNFPILEWHQDIVTNIGKTLFQTILWVAIWFDFQNALMSDSLFFAWAHHAVLFYKFRFNLVIDHWIFRVARITAFRARKQMLFDWPKHKINGHLEDTRCAHGRVFTLYTELTRMRLHENVDHFNEFHIQRISINVTWTDSHWNGNREIEERRVAKRTKTM